LSHHHNVPARHHCVATHVPRGCLIKRGHSLYQINRYEASLASYERAMALAPGDATILIYRARTLRQLGRCEEALAELDQALTQQPDFARVCNYPGELDAIRRSRGAVRACAQA
jgi:tetratricopeptide (TPR) repeat protein